MKKNKRLAVLIGTTLSLSISGLGFANQVPRALSTDNRMRVVPYNQNNVVTLEGQEMTITTLQFGEDEVVQGVKVGDSVAWEATTNQAHPNMLFIKPTISDADTNMTVLTNRHVYQFKLLVPSSPLDSPLKVAPTYNVRFTYPLEEAKAALARAAVADRERNAVVSDKVSPLDWNWDYSFSAKCQTDYVPIRAFDDGRFTYFQFKPNASIPAIFIVDGQGHESLANYHIKDQYVVIQKTAKQFSLRSGKVYSCVFNDHDQS